MVNKFYYKSPLGILEIIEEEGFLSSLKIAEQILNSEETVPLNIKKQLDEYFSGKRKTFKIKTKPNGTDFQKKVWQALSKIPYGETKSYGEIAESIGKKGAARAIGNACNKNPILLIIPCHRVIGKDGKLTGFGCGIEIKEKLLNLELENKSL